jgi:hypothetical protein
MNNLFFLWLVQQCYSHLFYGINNLLQFHIEVSQLKCVDHLYEHKHIQTKFTKNCDNKKVKRKALIHKLKTKGLGQCPKSFKIMCVLVLHRSTNHA